MAWDAETLKEYVDKLFEDRDRALEAALAAMEKRLDGMNEIRGQMKDQANTLATRAEVDAKFDGITKTTRATIALVVSIVAVAIPLVYLVVR